MLVSRLWACWCLTVAVGVLVGCSSSSAPSSADGDSSMTKDEARAEVHERVDEFAERIGTITETRADGPASLDPNVRYISHDYRVRVDIEPGALERLRGEIADDMREHGWTVHDDMPRNPMINLTKDDRTMVASVFEDKGHASVRGATMFKNEDD